MKIKNKNLEVKIGEEVIFEIKNPNWAHSIKMKGKVIAIQNRFNGFLHIEKGAISQDDFIIRKESIDR